MKQCALLVAAALLALIAVPADSRSRTYAQQDDGGAPALTLDAQINQFWTLWENEQPSEALRRLSPNPQQNPWKPLSPVVDDFQSRLGGKCLGHVQLERKKITDRVVYASLYAYYDLQPLRVELLYYKARDRWVGIACHVDDNATLWLHEISHPHDATTTPGAGQPGQPQGGQE